MSAVPVTESALLADTARRYADGFSLETLRELRGDSSKAGDRLRALWRDMAELGWTGLLVPEALGGTGGRFGHLAVVAEELGRVLAITPLVPTAVVAATVLAQAEGSVDILDGLCAGRSIVVLAHDEGPHAGSGRVRATATRVGDGYALDGTKQHVAFGPIADAFVLSAVLPGDDHPSLFLADRDAAGLRSTPGVRIDGQPVATLTLDKVPATLVSRAGAAALLEWAANLGAAALAAWMVGAMRQAFEITVEHLKTREQFGVPIGAFQALQHRAAQLHCDVVLATAILVRTVDALDAGEPGATQLVHACKAKVSDTYLRVAEEGLQLHGGIGMTDEAEIGFHLKAARAAEFDFGDAAYHRRRYATLAGY